MTPVGVSKFVLLPVFSTLPAAAAGPMARLTCAV
jgi:hypothetical protein